MAKLINYTRNNSSKEGYRLLITNKRPLALHPIAKYSLATLRRHLNHVVAVVNTSFTPSRE